MSSYVTAHDKTAVLIIGTGRSGTSCTAGVLQIMGLPLGDNLPAGNQYNEKGSFENHAISTLNHRLMHDLGMTNHEPKITKWHKNAHYAQFKTAIKTALTKEFGNMPFFGIKNPHITFFLPVYADALEELGYNLKIVVVTRNPEEVVASFIARYPDEPTERFYALVAKDLTMLMLYTPQYNPLVIDYNELLETPESVISMFNRFIPGLMPFNEIEHEALAFIDKDLKHQNIH